MSSINLVLDRLSAVLARRGTSRSQHYRTITEGTFTPPVRVGVRCAAWPRHEIDALVAAEIAGATREQLRQLVRQLMAQRSSFMPSLGVA